MSAETSVTVVGAGATGGYLAAQLAKAGVSVTLVARADSLRQIRSSGITLERPDGERETIRPERVLAPNEIEHRADLVLFCVKSYDTEAAAHLVTPLVQTTATSYAYRTVSKTSRFSLPRSVIRGSCRVSSTSAPSG